MKNALKLFRVIALLAVIGLTITCVGSDDGLSTVSVTGVKLNKNSISLTVGGTETLTATVNPSNATNKTVGWSSNNPSVATVTYGTITALSSGTATITVTTADGGKTDTCSVTVTIGGNKTLVSIAVTTPPNKTQYILGEEEFKTDGMVVTAAYGDGTTQTVTGYSTSGYNKNQIGNQTITVTYQGKTATFTINVIDPAKQTVATPTANPSGGTVPSGTMVTLSTATSGAEIWYTINGGTPAKNGVFDGVSIKYTSPFAVTPPLTIYAIAVKDGMNDSGILEAVYSASPIIKAEIEINAPTNGGTPATAISGEENNFTAGTVTWSPNDYSFLPNTEYTATVTLWAKSSFTFFGLTEATVNGQTATVSNNTGDTVTLTYKFPATGTKIVTDITIKSPPSKLNYTHGDTLDLSGLVVTLAYNDTTSEDVTAANFSDKGITANPSAGDNLVRSAHNGKPITITYGSLSKTTSNITVNAKNVSALTIDAIQEQIYTGSEIKPVITVKDGAVTLRLDEDYMAIYSNNTNAGTATVTIASTGDYTGSRAVNFTINKANPSVTWPSAATITYGAALSASALSGGASTPTGTFAWTTPSTIPTVTNSGYSVTFTPTEFNNYYTVGDTVNITVIPANLSGDIIISPSGTVAVNTQLTATYSGSETVSYQWKKDGSNVGTDSKNFTPTTKGNYTVTVSATNYNSKISATVTVNLLTVTEVSTSAFPYSVEAIAYCNDRFVAVGSNNRMAYSMNGTTWTAISHGLYSTSNTFYSIAFGNGIFVAGASSGRIAYSTNCTTWTAVADSTFGTSDIWAIAYGDNKFVAVGNNGKMAYSTDCKTWTAVADSTFGTSTIRSIVYGNGNFVAGGMSGKMAYSTDGISWTKVTQSIFINDLAERIKIAYGNGKFVAVSGYLYGKMAISTDGVTWTNVNTGTLFEYVDHGETFCNISPIAYGNGIFIAKGGVGNIAAISTDGITWTTALEDSLLLGINSIAYGNGKFVGIGANTNGGYIVYLSYQ